MDIRLFSEDQKEVWNHYVVNHSRGTFFHRAEWYSILKEGLGFKPFYIGAYEGGDLCGILPLALVKRPLFGPVLLSTPMCVYGGVVADRDDVRKELEDWAVRQAEALGVQYLELRNSDEGNDGFLTSDHFYTFKKQLLPDDDANMMAIPQKQRAEVRRGIAAGLKSVVNQDVGAFFKVYATSVRNLGTPVFSKKYLRMLKHYFPESCEITTIYAGDDPVSSVLSFYNGDEVLPYYGGGLPSARKCGAHAFMYWSIMCQAVEKGCTSFDFGRSMKNTGAYAFKKAWGFEPKALAYQYHLVKAKEMPDMNADSGANKHIMSVWKRCPLAVTNCVGPILYPVVA